MIFFNWKRIISNIDDYRKIVIYFKQKTNTRRRTKKFYSIDRKVCKNRQLSFILNIKPVLIDRTATDIDKVTYIALCSRRNYMDYSMTGDKTLDSAYVTKDVVTNNPLLSLEDGKIKFKYEELYNG